MRISLRQFNNFLTIVVIILALIILILPFAPRIGFWLKKRSDTTGGFVYQNTVKPRQDAKPIPKDNRVVIPSLLLDEPIKEGTSIGVLNNGGTWHRPKTSAPDKGGNTVIIGHRYTYKGLSTFYNLDKVKTGDPIILYWQGKEYDYRITEVKVVSPSTAEIEKNTDKPLLTIYTCTPLWNAKNRLVVLAEPIGAMP